MNMQYLPEKIFKSGFSFLKKTVAVSLIFFTSVLSAESYTLETLTENLLKNNPDIRTAQEEYNRSVLDYKDALGGMGPKIDLQISATYMVNPPVGSLSVNVDDILNAVSWPSGTKPTQTGRYVKIYDGMENTYYNFGLTLTQPLWTWGKLHNAAKLYKEVSNIQEIKLEYTEQKLKTELETRIITLMFLNKINEILEEEKILAEELVSYSEDAEKSGMLLHQDVVDARIQAKELDIAKQGVSEQITNQILELQRITGIEELSFEQIDYSFNTSLLTEIMNADKNELQEKALSGTQPSLKMVTQAKVIQDLAVKISKNSVYWKPDVGFEMSAGYGGSRFPFTEPNWARKDDYSLNLSLGVKTTVWDGGKKLNDVARSLSNAESAQINSDATRSTIRKTFMEQWNTFDVCTMKIEYQDLKIETAASKIQHQEVLFQNGYGSKADLLSAQIDQCNEKIERLQQELSRAAACMTIRFLCSE